METLLIGLALYVGISFLMAFWTGYECESRTVGEIIFWPVILWSKAIRFFHRRGEDAWMRK